MEASDKAELTFRRERWRSFCAGIIETAGNTFLLLIATRHFDAGPVAKAMVAAGGSVGLLLTPLTVDRVQKRGACPSQAAARILTVGAIAMLVGSIVPAAWGAMFALACVVGLATPHSLVPLLTQIYQDNYPAERRGRLYSRSVMIRIGAAMSFAAVAGLWLDPRPITGFPAWFNDLTEPIAAIAGRERMLILLFAGAFAAAAWSIAPIPSAPLPSSAGSHPLHAWRFVRSDRVFRQALIAWMLMGFANLAMLPIRIEYLGNPRYGLAKPAGEIALLTLVIPNLARLVISPVWGWLFDRMNFFAMRCALNLGFAIGIAAFFTSDTTPGLVIGALVYGISTAGGDVAWALWVTKFAPPGRVADYMSVHTFLTGIRGVMAPFIAFQVVQHFAPTTMGWVAGAMIVVATLILLPEIWTPGSTPKNKN